MARKTPPVAKQAPGVWLDEAPPAPTPEVLRRHLHNEAPRPEPVRWVLLDKRGNEQMRSSDLRSLIKQAVRRAGTNGTLFIREMFGDKRTVFATRERIAVNPLGCYYANDGTLMNADGTRNIFDDVDL